ncbi:Oligosaccharyltransferase complex subunit [Aphelenchoides bicaudatus]|nr:Oligosaccharyltransferase complex subunit [Aphelenchoides bicaudatus]
MEVVLSKTLFALIDPPNVRISLPKWVQLPSAMQTFSIVLVVYFMVTAGIVYDIINEPPSIGSFVDERGIQRPQAIMPYRINGQYILEGLVASFMFSLTAIGMIILDKTNKAQTTRANRLILLSVGSACVAIGYLTTRTFIKIKMPGYLA